MGITLFLALLCANAQAQTSADSSAGQPARTPPKPLYYQMTQNSETGPTKAQADAMARAKTILTSMNNSIQSAVGSQSAAPVQAAPSANRLPASSVTAPNPDAMEINHGQTANPAAALMKLDPNSLPANSPLNKAVSPEEEKAAQYLQDQSKKMQEALKDMELSN